MADPTRIGGEPPISRPEQVAPSRRTDPGGRTTRPGGSTGGTNFAEILRARQGVVPSPTATGTQATSAVTPASPQASEALRFSAHAQTRLQSRGIQLEPADMTRLQSAVGRAAAKGSRDTVVLMDNTAFVVSVTNRTVVTVVDQSNLKQNVFTNIDSAVIA